MLKFDSSWRYESPGEIPNGVEGDFIEIIRKIANGKQEVLETFKDHFAAVSGHFNSWSSSSSWADTDLCRFMDDAANNAPLFIEAFYKGWYELKEKGEYHVPDIQYINKVLAKHNAKYRIEPPNLIAEGSQTIAPPPEIPASLDQRAQDIIQKSIIEGQKLLSEGRYRQAVQEVLWLLETVTTAFQGLNDGETSIGGEYFNKIVEELRRNYQGTTLEQIIGWITRLHGYLSAPSGGGIRHGMHIEDGVETSKAEAWLYYNLIVSYTSFLLSEYERIKARSQ